MSYITDEEMLSMTVMEGKLSTMRILLKGGVDVDHASGKGFTALMLACKGEFNFEVDDSLQERIVLTLLEAGANVNLTDVYGRTSLMLACKTGCSIGVLAYLLECGADPTMKDKNEQTAFDYAINNHHYGIAHYLREFELCHQQHFYMNWKGTDQEKEIAKKDILKFDIPNNEGTSQICFNLKSCFANSKLFKLFTKQNNEQTKKMNIDNIVKTEVADDNQTNHIEMKRDSKISNVEKYKKEEIDNKVIEIGMEIDTCNKRAEKAKKEHYVVLDNNKNEKRTRNMKNQIEKSQIIDQTQDEMIHENNVCGYNNEYGEHHANHGTNVVIQRVEDNKIKCIHSNQKQQNKTKEQCGEDNVSSARQTIKTRKVMEANGMNTNFYIKENKVTKSCKLLEKRENIHFRVAKLSTVCPNETKILHRRNNKSNLTNDSNLVVENKKHFKIVSSNIEMKSKHQNLTIEAVTRNNSRPSYMINHDKYENTPKPITCRLTIAKDFVPVHNFNEKGQNVHTKRNGPDTRLSGNKLPDIGLNPLSKGLVKNLQNRKMQSTTQTGNESLFKLPSIT